MTEQPEIEWRYVKTEPAPDEMPDPSADDGCKDCCSIICGAFSLTGLVAILASMLAHKIRRGKNG